MEYLSTNFSENGVSLPGYYYFEEKANPTYCILTIEGNCIYHGNFAKGLDGWYLRSSLNITVGSRSFAFSSISLPIYTVSYDLAEQAIITLNKLFPVEDKA